MQIQPTPEQQEIIESLKALTALLLCLRPMVEHMAARKKGSTGKQPDRRAKPPE